MLPRNRNAESPAVAQKIETKYQFTTGRSELCARKNVVQNDEVKKMIITMLILRTARQSYAITLQRKD